MRTNKALFSQSMKVWHPPTGLSFRNESFPKYFLIYLLLCTSVYAHAQHSLKGVIKDANNNNPVSYATVNLLRSDSSVVTGKITGDDGKFIIENVAAGDYALLVSTIGYKKVNNKVNLPGQSDLGDIFLSESANHLSEVVVKADRPLVTVTL